MSTARCPRCSEALRPPGLMSSDWACARHGAVLPLTVHLRPTADAVRQLAARPGVPLWAPLPLLPHWTLASIACAGDDRSGARGTAVALAGPSPLGGPADLLLVAEEPGVGLGARLAGTEGPDPGAVPTGPPDAKVLASGHPTPLWRCPSAEDRMAFVGEAAGIWLWAVLWPPAAELLLLEHVELHDLRAEPHASLDLPIGASSPRLDL